MAEKKRYRALRDLFYPTDAQVIKRLVEGENMPLRGRGMRMVAVGDVVDDIPSASIPILLKKGFIREVK